MDLSHVIVCSFHTADDYYRSHANKLRTNLDQIGVAYEIEEIPKAAHEDWADICRKKISFLARVCAENPSKKVFWIDVDCLLLDMPAFVVSFSGDIVGFARGFGPPLQIGYANRTRFWEPCFFGINSTPAARKFVQDAANLEQSADIKATDDYFFEESWRANAAYMSFQIIPSAAVVGKSSGMPNGVPAFFAFGSSGNVAKFKDAVRQHDQINGSPRTSITRRLRRKALRAAKLIERTLPNQPARSFRKLADSSGITHVLTGGGQDSSLFAPASSSAHRRRTVGQMVAASQRGESATVAEAFDRLTSSRIPSELEISAKQAADSFVSYASKNLELTPVRLAWWPRPFPGNFGDWLSPLIVSSYTDRSVQFQSPTAPSHYTHIFGTGSIGRFIKSASVVVGTGVSSTDVELDPNARYVAVRGPLTAQLVKECGGPSVECMGDPGVLISRILPMDRELINGRVALVRHFKHLNLPVVLPDHMDEFSVLVSHPNAIESMMAELIQYDAVITSAMHVMIACHSYGIPCALITFAGFESAVHGSGMKYRDYSLGAGLDSIHEPTSMPLDLRRFDFDSILSKDRIKSEKLDEVEGAVKAGIAMYLSVTT